MTVSVFPKSFFVTGTDTGVGKTVVSAILTAGLSAAYWKPIQSGAEELTDTEWIQRATGLPDCHFIPETYRLSKPLSPHAAAISDGVRIMLDKIRLPQTNHLPHLIVEGAGGVLVPINDRQYMVDLMKHLKLPVLLVSRSSLGTINHTLLSLQSLRHSGLDVIGIVINGPKNQINRTAIEFYGKVKVCAEVEILPRITTQTILESYQEYFNINSEL